MRDSCLAFLFNKSNYTIGLAKDSMNEALLKSIETTRDICWRYLDKIRDIGAFTKEPGSSADSGAG